MSLKRYAILAAVSQQQQQQQQQQHNATVLSTAMTTTATAAATSTTATSSPSSEEESLHSQELGSSSSITTYYNGGMGLYNQQRAIGGGGGISLLNGVASGNSHGGAAATGGSGSQSYAHVVNGSVNLLLGGSMLCLVMTILCVVCYCCHRNIKKRTEAAYRQQQHQWLENDPNMEIYSVEQCYETSGLFMGDSTDGLAALPTLHHEPPPSYDAVVLHEQQLLQQQQQQLEEQQLQMQQQQLMLHRVSPPPGYRSTLDMTTMQQQLNASTGGSVDAVAGSSNGEVAGSLAIDKQLQRTLNAQSCCSLQRAEVENMWNAAAAAVVARNGHCQELDSYLASPSPPIPFPLALQARKHAQAAMRLNSFGRRYLQHSQHHLQQHSHYRRGCPLCGKFRYAAEDEMLTASVESGLEHCDDNENVASTEQQLEQTTAAAATAAHYLNGNQIDADVVAAGDGDVENGNVVDTSATNAAVETVSTAADIDENDNAAAIATSVAATSAATSTETAATMNSGNNATQDIDNINENGIISLDMSKIIDISGLPTYEGALKLESSGYV